MTPKDIKEFVTTHTDKEITDAYVEEFYETDGYLGVGFDYFLINEMRTSLTKSKESAIELWEKRRQYELN